MAMTTLAIVLAVQTTTSRYDIAGLYAALYVISSAFCAPLIMRAVDRLGQRAVTSKTLTVHVLALASLYFCLLHGAHLVLAGALTLLAGLTYGSMGSLVRARWAYLTSTHAGDSTSRSHLLDSAYALEAVIDEAIFITGPILVVALAPHTTPGLGLPAAATCVALGAVWFLSRTRTEPPVQETTSQRTALYRLKHMPVVMAALVGLGSVFGTLEISTIAASDAAGAPHLTGVTLACFAAGSLVGGLWYGTVTWKAPAHKRFAVASVALVVTSAATVPAAGSYALLPAGFVSGLAIAPALIAAVAVIADLVPAAAFTEAMAYESSCLALGLATGTAVGGYLIEKAGWTYGFPLMLCAAAITAALACLLTRQQTLAANHRDAGT